MNLLIVEDDPTSRMVLRHALEAEGHTSVEVVNGVEALRVLEGVSVDGVISDILMPAMDGFRLCLEIRRSNKLNPRLPVVLYTATYDSLSDRQLAEASGADAYFLKPTPIPVLMEAVRAAQSKADRAKADQIRADQTEAASTPAAGGNDEAYVLEQYNAALVRKLEHRSSELHETFMALQASHQQILESNRTLERRIAQRTAALEAANRELDAFCNSVSQDLRAPLRDIICLSQVLETSVRKQLGGENLQLLAKVSAAAQRMDALIEGLLDVERTNRREVTRAEVDLEVLLEEALRWVAQEGVDRKIEWRRTRLPIATGDATLLRQVLVALLSNAIKYTRTRPRPIIEVGTRSGRADEVVVFVRDNGVGFDLRGASSLFEPFRRLHGAAEFGGIGVGLAKAQRIIARHGGRIWADARVDRGATFFFSLPAPGHGGNPGAPIA